MASASWTAAQLLLLLLLLQRLQTLAFCLGTRDGQTDRPALPPHGEELEEQGRSSLAKSRDVLRHLVYRERLFQIEQPDEMLPSGSTRTPFFGQYEMHGFHPDPTLSDDENLMTMCMLVTRNSICRQGHMGCILLGNPSDQADMKEGDRGNDEAASGTNSAPQRLYQRVIGVSTNKPLYSELDSDVHAEIGAIGDAARHGNCTDGCTAYITMPPCKNCFGALISAGCKRIISPRPPSTIVEVAAKARGVEMITLEQDTVDRIRARIDTLINGVGCNDVEKRKADIAAKRKARKEASKLKKEKRRHISEESIRNHEESKGH